METKSRFYSVLFFAAFLVIGITSALTGTTVTYLTERFAIPAEQGGLFITLHTLGATLSTLVIGQLIDRLNSRALCWTGPMFLALGALLLTVVTEGWMAFGSIFIVGMGFGSVLVCGNALVGRLYAHNPAPQLNLLNVFFGFGGILGPQLVNLALSFQSAVFAFTMMGGLALALLPLFLFIHVAPTEKAKTGGGLNQHWVTLLPFVLLMFIYTGAEIGFGAWIFTQLTRVTGVTEANGTVGVSLFWFGLTAGRILASVLSRSVKAELILIGTALLLTGATALLLILSGVESASMVSTFLVGLGAGPIFPTGMAIVTRRYPESAGTASALMIGAGNIGAALLPWVQGQAGRGVDGGMIVTLAAGVALALLSLAIAQQTRRRVEAVG